MPIGRVILAGAGPGDPRLITTGALDALASAEVVVYDRLVSPAILAKAPERAEMIDVGKVPGSQKATQALINEVLIAKAKAGKVVVRLKGGDPYVFGRGGEEALALLDAGVPFEVIPGVTAGVAVSASAGIPVTHRGLASCVTFITGHEDPTKPESDLNYSALAATGGTLVFYMGVRQLGSIASRLMAAGLSGETPAACIQSGTTPSQRSIRETLADLAQKAADAHMEPPAITVVGAVAGLPGALNVFEARPLFGRRIVNTRPEGQAVALAESLGELGAEVISLPTIETRRLPRSAEADGVFQSLGRYHWLIFTSPTAVEFFFERMAELSLDARALQTARVACIGPATSDALSKRSILPDFRPAHFDGESLVQEIAPCDIRGRKVLLPRSDIARKELREGLERLGAEVTDLALYRTITHAEPPAEALRRVRRGDGDIVTFTSSSTVEGFVEIVGREALDGLKDKVSYASIGPVTSATMRLLGLDVSVEAKEHTAAGLVQAIVDFAARR